MPAGRLGACFLLAAAFAVPAQDRPQTPAFSKAQQRGVDYLLSQAHDGLFTERDKPHLGVTALALAAVLTKPAGLRTEAEKKHVEQASRFLFEQQNDDGSFGDQLVNYQTSAVVQALSKLDTDEARKALSKARDFLVFAQNVERGGFTPEDVNYGSFGDGPGDRGDLSNTQFAVEALRSSGLDENHEAFAKAIVFLQRTQNLRSVNSYHTEMSERGSDEKFRVEPGNDGGAAYYPGNSKFGYDVMADGVHVPRSYGSMTYALLKTYALCGLDPEDERIVAATDWIRHHWTLEVNPGAHAGMGDDAPYQGLFYYYQTMARALMTCGVDVVKTLGDDEKEVPWRRQLAEHLAAIQREDGSWLNDKNGRWWEDQPVMCTVYALLALEDCQEASTGR